MPGYNRKRPFRGRRTAAAGAILERIFGCAGPNLKRFAGRFAVYWAPLLVWMGVIYGWSSLSIDTVKRLEPWDGTPSINFSAVHFAEFALLAALAYWAFRSIGRLSLPALWGAVVAFTMLYAVSDEIHQSFTPGRSASYADFAVDLLGGVTGLATADSLSQWLSLSPRRFRLAKRRQGDEADRPPG